MAHPRSALILPSISKITKAPRIAESLPLLGCRLLLQAQSEIEKEAELDVRAKQEELPWMTDTRFSERLPRLAVLRQLCVRPREDLRDTVTLRRRANTPIPREQVVDDQELGAKQDQPPLARELPLELLDERAPIEKWLLSNVVMRLGEVVRAPQLLLVVEKRAVLK